MRALAMLAAIFLAVAAAVHQRKQEDFGLPELHKIKTITLGPAYSCRSAADFQRGYENTALFLSDYSRRSGGPDLLFNGACGGMDDFENSPAGDDMGVIADLGEIPLEKLTAHLIFNTRNVASFELYSKFARTVKVQLNHTYAAMANQYDVRSLFLFTVTGYVPNKSVDLRYAVKQYQVLELKASSPGFDWTTENAADPGGK